MGRRLRRREEVVLLHRVWIFDLARMLAWALSTRSWIAWDAALVRSRTASERTASFVALYGMLAPRFFMVASEPAKSAHLPVSSIDYWRLWASQLSMAISCRPSSLKLPFWLEARAFRLMARILACLVVKVKATSCLLSSLLLEQLLGCLHLGLVPHRLGPALNVVVVSIVLVFKLLRLGVL